MILHLPQYVLSHIKDEQLCALGDAVFFFFFSVPRLSFDLWDS